MLRAALAIVVISLAVPSAAGQVPGNRTRAVTPPHKSAAGSPKSPAAFAKQGRSGAASTARAHRGSDSRALPSKARATAVARHNEATKADAGNRARPSVRNATAARSSIKPGSRVGITRSPAKGNTAAPARVASRAPAEKGDWRGRSATPGRTTPAIVVSEDTPTPAADDPDRARILRIQDSLRGVVHGGILGRLRVGMRVIEAATGRLIYGSHVSALMDPASNQKVLATAAAMLRLGADWRYLTQLSGPEPDAEGVIRGNIYLQGSGDPTLTLRDIDAMAQAVRASGVTRIDGAVVADPRRLGSGDEDGASERPQLVVGGGLAVVRVNPGAKSGSPAAVSMNADDDVFQIRNRATTKAKGRSRVNVVLSLSGNRVIVDVSGRVVLNKGGVVARRRVPHSGLHAAIVMRRALLNAGVEVRDAPAVGRSAANPVALALHRSAPLSILLRKINKDSNNDQAERILVTVGAEALGGAATTQKGLAVLREVLSELGLEAGDYVSHNGSGLGHANRISPRAMSDLLRTLYLDPRIGPEMMQSLSIGGVDGTTRNRFRHSLAAKHVRAKTGTLNGKSCLSGYVGDGPDLLVFSILVDGFRHRKLSAVRSAQVVAVDAMMRFIRDKQGERVEGEAVGQDAPIDYETGEEAHEREGDSSDPDEQAPSPTGEASTGPTSSNQPSSVPRSEAKLSAESR